jgi:sec-independent protein translocase protein TatA
MNVLYFMPIMVMGWEWIIIILIVILLFGGKKIPELMRGIGKGISNFKKGMKEDDNENNKE